MDKKKAIIKLIIGIILIAIIAGLPYFIFQNLELINENSGALSLIFSALVATATIFYVFLTWKLVSLNEEFRDPSIIVDFQPSSKWINFKNEGKRIC